MIIYLTISRRRRADYKPIFTESEATHCFGINFQVLTNNFRQNFIKITVMQKAIVTGQ